MILLVGGEKGGSGKSCVAQNLAVYLRLKFNTDVMMVDCDPQRTTSDWIQARNSNFDLPMINCVQLYGNIKNDLLSLKNRYSFVVVDCGGQDNYALRSSMVVASHVLLPLRPKRRDLKTLPHMEDMVSNCLMVNPNMEASVVMTQCPALPSQAGRILEAKEVVRSFGMKVLNAMTFYRNIYDDSEEQGLSVMEVDENSKASEEIRSIATEFLLPGVVKMRKVSPLHQARAHG